jgi:hypothetical protein
MKLSTGIVLASMAASTQAFVQPSIASSSALRMAEEPVVTEMEATISEEAQPVIESIPEPGMSQSMPFMARPVSLDGSLAGDVGFDPIGFAKNSDDLMKYREAEIKHARLAMLAAAGWPISELFDAKIAGVLGMNPVVDGADRVPSLLNGGLGKVSPVYWVACLAGAAAIDLYGIKVASQKPGYTPGDYGLDFFGLYPKDEEGQKWFQTAELKNGRLAMIAITAFAVQEFVSNVGVIDETPLFFKPIAETAHEYVNSGYILH